MRTAAAIVILLSSLLYLVAIFKGAGNLFERFLRIPYEGAVGITLVIVMLYTSIGGFVSVVRTDVVQGVLMILGSTTIFFFVFNAAGGMSALPALVVSSSPMSSVASKSSLLPVVVVAEVVEPPVKTVPGGSVSPPEQALAVRA